MPCNVSAVNMSRQGLMTCPLLGGFSREEPAVFDLPGVCETDRSPASYRAMRRFPRFVSGKREKRCRRDRPDLSSPSRPNPDHPKPDMIRPPFRLEADAESRPARPAVIGPTAAAAHTRETAVTIP